MSTPTHRNAFPTALANGPEKHVHPQPEGGKHTNTLSMSLEGEHARSILRRFLAPRPRARKLDARLECDDARSRRSKTDARLERDDARSRDAHARHHPARTDRRRATLSPLAPLSPFAACTVVSDDSASVARLAPSGTKKSTSGVSGRAKKGNRAANRAATTESIATYFRSGHAIARRRDGASARRGRGGVCGFRSRAARDVASGLAAAFNDDTE
jgi:hypothetical protein